MDVVYVDHYDSFTFNLIDWLETKREKINIIRMSFDDPELLPGLLKLPRPLVFSPGPRSPVEAAQSRQLLMRFLGQVPVLGVCLGAQIMGQLAGLKIARSAFPLHGATKKIVVRDSGGIFSGTPSEMEMGCYHSLVVTGECSLKHGWVVSAYCEKGEVMGLEYESGAETMTAGVQFHPESFLSRGADILADNWIRSVGLWYGLKRQRAR